MDKKQAAVTITDIDYQMALDRINELSEMNAKLVKSATDRLVRAEAAEFLNMELTRQLEQARKDLKEYREEIDRLTVKVWTS